MHEKTHFYSSQFGIRVSTRTKVSRLKFELTLLQPRSNHNFLPFLDRLLQSIYQGEFVKIST